MKHFCWKTDRSKKYLVVITIGLIICGLRGEELNGVTEPENIVPVIVKCAPAGGVFTLNEPLVFEFEETTPQGIEYTIYNQWGEKIHSAQIIGKNLVLPSLACGYYSLEINGLPGRRTFAVVTAPPIPARPNCFFALDTAMSWLAVAKSGNIRHPQDAIAETARLAWLSGTGVVRDRLGWKEVQPNPNSILQWGRYRRSADALSQYGIKVLSLYHDAPAWTKSSSKAKLPDDLFAIYHFSREAGAAFRGRMIGWEFWNEQDLGFALESSWDFAAAQKAAYLGFKAGDPETPVLLGGLARLPREYTGVILKNGTADYFDIFNFHLYQQLRDIPDYIAQLRKFMAHYQIEKYPIWMTEVGLQSEGSARSRCYMPKLKAHSAKQELLVSEYTVKAQILYQMLGVQRCFSFVLCPFSEENGGKDWGFLRRDFSAKPVFVAFAVMTRMIGEATLEGKVNLGMGLEGYFYRNADGTPVLIFWSRSELDSDGVRPDLSPDELFNKSISLAVDGSGILTDLFGTSRPIVANAGKLRLVANRYPQYLTGFELHTITPAAPPRGKTMVHKTFIERNVVLKVRLSGDFQLSATRDFVRLKKRPATLQLELCNFSDTALTGKVSFSGMQVSGMPESVTILPMTRQRVALTLDFPQKNSSRTEFLISGIFGDRPVAPVMIPIVQTDKLGSDSATTTLPVENPGRWEKNAAGETEIAYDAIEKAVVFVNRFSKNVRDGWSYPLFLLQLPQETLTGSAWISFEWRVDAPDRIGNQNIMLVTREMDGSLKNTNLKLSPPSDGWRAELIRIPELFDMERVVGIRFGGNLKSSSQKRDFSISLRKMRFICNP